MFIEKHPENDTIVFLITKEAPQCSSHIFKTRYLIFCMLIHCLLCLFAAETNILL
jgi:hypothetical protein